MLVEKRFTSLVRNPEEQFFVSPDYPAAFCAAFFVFTVVMIPYYTLSCFKNLALTLAFTLFLKPKNPV
jgi:hypothetical protein